MVAIATRKGNCMENQKKHRIYVQCVTISKNVVVFNVTVVRVSVVGEYSTSGQANIIMNRKFEHQVSIDFYPEEQYYLAEKEIIEKCEKKARFIFESMES